MDAPVIKSGTVINVDGHEVVIIDLATRESPDGRSVVVRAVDKENADKIQRETIEQEQIKDETLDSLKNLLRTVGPKLQDFLGGEKGL